MSKWHIVAYGEPEEGLKSKEITIEANTREEAERIAWREFPEYHEIGVYRKDD